MNCGLHWLNLLLANPGGMMVSRQISGKSCCNMTTPWQHCLIYAKRVGTKNILENWRIATVVLLFKKGDTALPSNYRPISLFPVGYKVLAWMVQKRLQLGGAEERIRATQFGFRQKKSSAEAVAVIRRIFDAAYSAGKPSTITFFLDWAKAFDKIKIDFFMAALRRFQNRFCN